MKLILALGNPEIRYNSTRHNVGFWLVDEFVRRSGLSWKEKSKFNAVIAEQGTGDNKLIIAKPTTYYNEVGQSMRALIDFYKLSPNDILIIADDLALPFGTVRIRNGGSGAGNNGIKSINSHGGLDTLRMRIGVWNELRDKMNDADFVLSRFTKTESDTLMQSVDYLLSLINDFANNSLEITTHRVGG